MNELQIHSNPELGSIRSLMVNGEPYFVGKDVAEILGYGNTRDALEAHVDEEDKVVIQKSEIATLEIPNRGLTVINESGMYSLILSSKLPKAKRFKHWVTSEVLPAIQKTGSYGVSVSRQFELFKEASLIAEKVTPEVYPYLLEILKHKEKFEEPINLNGRLVGLTREDMDAIDHALEAYAAVYNYYRDNGSESLDTKALIASDEMSWARDVGAAILNSAAFLGRKHTGPRIEDGSRMAFSIPGINRDGTVRIPKIGTFHVDPEIILGNNQVYNAFVERGSDDTYTIKFSLPKERN